jgi:hypothetical protein
LEPYKCRARSLYIQEFFTIQAIVKKRLRGRAAARARRRLTLRGIGRYVTFLGVRRPDDCAESVGIAVRCFSGYSKNDHGHMTGGKMWQSASKSQFKAKALEMFRQIEASGEPLVITDHGEPKLEVRRFTASERAPLAVLRGSVLRFDDPTAPVADGDWAAAQ